MRAVAVSTAVQVAYVEFTIDANLKGEPGTKPGSQDFAARPDAVARPRRQLVQLAARRVMVHGESQVHLDNSMRRTGAMQKSNLLAPSDACTIQAVPRKSERVRSSVVDAMCRHSECPKGPTLTIKQRIDANGLPDGGSPRTGSDCLLVSYLK